MKHKPLNWIKHSTGEYTTSISHSYNICLSKEGWIVTTRNFQTNSSHSDKVCSTLEEAKDWVENIHVPDKTKELINAFIDIR